jgi:thioredoxin-like negative regulator of GroEL
MSMREDIDTIDALKTLIAQKVGVMVYFSTPTCNVCHALRPKISEAFSEHFPEIEQVFIDAAKTPDIPASLQIFSVPTILVYLDGKEFARESRNVSVPLLVEKIRRPYEIMTT